MTDHCGYADVPEASMNMREMMARALCEADGENPNAFYTTAAYDYADKTGCAMGDHAIPLWRQPETSRRVKAILSTLMNPTPEMIEAVLDVDEDHLVGSGDKYDSSFFRYGSAETHVWQAMIRAAKEEG